MAGSFFDPYYLAWRNLRSAAWQLIIFDFWFGLIYSFVLIPLSAWLLNRLVVHGGQTVISNTDLVNFFLSIRGILFIVFSITFLLTFWYLEQIGLFIISRAAIEDRHVSVSTVLGGETSLVPGLIRLGLLQAMVYVAACLPFLLGAALTYFVLLSDRDIYYFVSVQPWQWWAALAIAGILVISYLLVAVWLTVRWLFAVPVLAFENAGAVDALSRSWRRTRQRFWSLGIPLGVWWLFILAASSLSIWLLRTIVAHLLSRTGLNLTVILPLVLGGLAIMALITAAWFIAGKAVFAILVITFYGDSGGKQSERRETAGLLKYISPSGLKWLAWTGAGIALVSAVISGILLLRNVDLERQIAVTAHRGSSSKAPENTMSALQQAVADGADFAEIDVQTTADGQVVLLHDADLLRIAGVNRRIQDIRWEELKELDVGSWFSPDFSHERTATLEQAVAYARGRIRLNIELKYNRPDPALAVEVGHIIRWNDFAGECVVSSLDYDALQQVKKTIPEVRAGLIVFRALGNLSRSRADFLSINAAQATRGLVRQAHARGMEVHVWTVNDLQATLSMIEMGVDNIITDSPPFVLSVIGAWQNLSDAQKIALWLRRFFIDIDKSLTGQQ